MEKEKSKINWPDLRESFFNECTENDPNGMKKVVLTPHNLFEWFKAEMNEYLASEQFPRRNHKRKRWVKEIAEAYCPECREIL